jgi:quinol monooxygenase YgiN
VVVIAKMARYRVKADKRDEVVSVLEEFVKTVKEKEPSTLRYVAYRLEDGVSFVHIMYFKDEEAERRHREASYVKKFEKLLHPNCEEEPRFFSIVPVPAHFL